MAFPLRVNNKLTNTICIASQFELSNILIDIGFTLYNVLGQKYSLNNHATQTGSIIGL